MKKQFLLLTLVCIYGIASAQECLNLNYRLRGYFYAGTSIIDSTALGGFYEDDNLPKKITSEISGLTKANQLEIIAKTDMENEFKKGIAGFKVFLVNKTDSVASFTAQDSNLYIKRQVFYKNEWIDIEYIPSSSCGNSYHIVYLKPNEYWEFIAPCLQGKIKAKFRFELMIDRNHYIYSNEFEGSFNKKQLKKYQVHTPIGIMDPYKD